jgi:hypothetical protein
MKFLHFIILNALAYHEFKNLTHLFCERDDFCKEFIPAWEKIQLDEGGKKTIQSML